VNGQQVNIRPRVGLTNLINKVHDSYKSSTLSAVGSARTTLRWLVMKLLLIMEDGITGSGLCPRAGFGISGTEPLGSAVR
jgi:hypothetical protein